MSAYLRPPVVGNFKDPTYRQKNSKRRQQREGMSSKHEALIRKLPCCVTGAVPAGTIHHLKSGPAKRERGVGMRATDQWGVPLAPVPHDAIEQIGSRHERQWFLDRGIDPHLLAFDLWNASGDEAAMFAVVIAHRRSVANPTTTEQELAMKTPIAEQIAEAQREQGMRERLYPVWCKAGRMTIEESVTRRQAWKAVVELLEYCQHHRDAINTAIKTMTADPAAAIDASTAALISEVRRELTLRESVYGKKVEAKEMIGTDAAIRIKRTRAMIGTLEFYGRNKKRIEAAIEVCGTPFVKAVEKAFPDATVTKISEPYHQRGE